MIEGMSAKFRTLVAAGLALGALSLPAAAGGSVKDEPADEGRKLTWSFNLAGTSDYVFRGISQTDNDPTVQGGLDLSYGIFYAGVWASGLDFDAIGNDAEIEVDVYGGIKPVWGPATFDLGVIYYAYPGANKLNPPVTLGLNEDLAYFELKAGVSGAFISALPSLTMGATVFYSPDYFAGTGSVWTVEGSMAYTFNAIGPVTPTVSALIGYQDGGDAEYEFFNGFDSYTYWNAGLTLAVDKLSFDFRYWGTDAEDAASANLTCINNYCDDRFVFTAKVALP